MAISVHSSYGQRRTAEVRRGLLLSLALACAGLAAADGTPLEDGFRNPPLSARPHTWYHMMNGNVTKAGITRDFEAIAEVGLGGVQMFDAGCDIPAGTLRFNTPEWFDLLRHAVTEAKRLDLEVCLPNCSGWSSAGGPWIGPTNCMKGIQFAETGPIKGPSRFSARLPNPGGGRHYRDVAVIAYPVPLAELADVQPPDVQVSDDGHSATATFARDVECAGFTLHMKGGSLFAAQADMKVEASSDGKDFHVVFERRDVTWGDEGSSYRIPVYFPFPDTVRAATFRLTMTQKSYGRIGKIAAFAPEGARRVSDLPGKRCTVRQLVSQRNGTEKNAKNDAQGKGAPAALPRFFLKRDDVPARADHVIPADRIVDLTPRLRNDGAIDWDVPEGTWRIMRFGYAPMNNSVHPASDGGKGLEVDKLSPAALDFHFEQYVGRLCRMLGTDLVGRDRPGLAGTLLDSYEAGSQNWTDGFERTFAQRMGYNPTRYFPALAGHVVGSVEETERFFEDFRRLVSDLFCEGFTDALTRKCHEYGIACSAEPYGNGPFDDLRYGQNVDIPMSEMWSGGLKRQLHPGNARLASSIAHVWGRRLCGAESFTAGWPYAGRFRTTPYSIKAQCDLTYANGVNRIIYHRFTHQPWTGRDYAPGMTMGQWGMCFDRTQTWWYDQREWIAYQSRCQWMLQEGRFAADALYFQGEDAPNRADSESPCDGRPSRAAYPDGIDYDWCGREAVLTLEVADDGRIVAPGGVRYRLLVLPDSDTMSREVLAKVNRLLDAGAKVCATHRPTRFPGLRGWPQDAAAFADEVSATWSKGIFEMNAADALKRIGAEPDVLPVTSSTDGRKLEYPRFAWIHRTDGKADWYFVTRANDVEETLTVSFRQRGRTVELWDPETGNIVRAMRTAEKDGRTEVTFDLKPNGSTFVVFRDSSDAMREAIYRKERDVPVTGGWTLSFPPGRGAPECVALDELVDWTRHPENGVNYFSGTATYRKTLPRPEGLTADAARRIILDLGDVKHFATVSVNGKTHPTMWRSPFRVDVTDAIGDAAKIDLEVKVTNLWPNRMIGDERTCKPDCEWSPVGRGCGIAKIPDWVKRGEKSPSGRFTFCTWRHWTAKDELLPSGMLGPVKLTVERRIEE